MIMICEKIIYGRVMEESKQVKFLTPWIEGRREEGLLEEVMKRKVDISQART